MVRLSFDYYAIKFARNSDRGDVAVDVLDEGRTALSSGGSSVIITASAPTLRE
jgi:hypothetical protein